MDLDGVWRAPQQWPEDTPPLDGWIRSSDGQWHAPTPVSETEDDERDPVTIADNSDKIGDADGAPRRSRQAEADRKAMFTVVGVIAATLLLLAAALVLITQASAEDIPEAADEGGSVVFAAETDEVKMQRRLAAAIEAPAVARAQLDALRVRPDAGELDDLAGYDLIEWTAERTDCLDIAEEVLVERSQSPVLWGRQARVRSRSGALVGPVLVQHDHSHARRRRHAACSNRRCLCIWRRRLDANNTSGLPDRHRPPSHPRDRYCRKRPQPTGPRPS